MLLRSLARLLRPLVRLLIQSGVTCPVLADMLRGLYIDVAINDLLPDPKSRTDSRISLMTGVHRKEIRRHRAPDAAQRIPDPVTRSSAIIGRWLGAATYTGADHAPLRLPRSGPEPSFEALVTSVTRDVRPRAVLEEWLAQGIVSLHDDDSIVLNVAAFIPQQGQEAQVFYFARNLHDHLAAAAANVTAAAAPRFLDRSLHYDRLSAPAAARLEEAGRAAGQTMLLDLNRIANAIADADADAPDGVTPAGPWRRVNVGVYVYLDDDPADEEPET